MLTLKLLLTVTELPPTVPADGKFFFANDIFKGFTANPAVNRQMSGGADPSQTDTQ